jgi:DNA-binding CsgD family transcriptional regulator
MTPYHSVPAASLHPQLALTEREMHVLALVSTGERTPAIAERLGISENTVKSHLTNIYRKTGSRNRVQAARHYLANIAQPAADADPASESTGVRLIGMQQALVSERIRELERRVDELLPAAEELQRVKRAITSLRTAAAAQSGAAPATRVADAPDRRLP